MRRLLLNEIFTHHAIAGTLMRVPFSDHAIFVDPRDDRIASTLLAGRPWQRHHLERAIQTLRTQNRLTENRVFLDIGANIGALTLYALLSGAFARSLALEPDPSNRKVLERNLIENDLVEQVTVLAAAASASAHRAELNLDAKNLGAHSLEDGFSMSAGEKISVRADRLDTLLDECDIQPGDVALAKIDVEGHEFAVLEGAQRLLSAGPALMLEVVFDGEWDRDRLQTLIGPAYSLCLDLDSPPGSGPVPLDEFAPKAMQHELLLF
jgi:FkbM family methyltransferase